MLARQSINDVLIIFESKKVTLLNLPDYKTFLNFDEALGVIFDPIRKKHVALTPEEWVRQNFIQHLVNTLGFPLGLMSVEKNIELNGLQKRCDIVVHNKQGFPVLIVECKAPSVNISQKTFDQIAIYNIKLQVEYLIATNGICHYCCQVDIPGQTYQFMKDFPAYNVIQ